jgi:hypothetical protein
VSRITCDCFLEHEDWGWKPPTGGTPVLHTHPSSGITSVLKSSYAHQAKSYRFKINISFIAEKEACCESSIGARGPGPGVREYKAKTRAPDPSASSGQALGPRTSTPICSTGASRNSSSLGFPARDGRDTEVVGSAERSINGSR